MNNAGQMKVNSTSYLIFIALLLITIFLGLILFGCDSRTEQYHIEILAGDPGSHEVVTGFKERMAELGYVEGQNILYSLNDFSTFSDPTQEVRIKTQAAHGADLIFTLFTEVSLVAREASASTGTPMVFAYAAIEDTGLIKSIREPGGRITGVRYPGPEQIIKRLEILNQIAPQNKRIFIVYVRDYATIHPVLTELRTLARSLGVSLVEAEVQGLDDLEKELLMRDQLPDPGMDAILLMPDNVNHSHAGWKMIRDFAARHDLPIAGSFFHAVEQGALFGNANDMVEVGRQAAPLVDKILQGIPAGTIPVVSPEPDLYINYKRAQELGLDIPEGLLRQAKSILQ
ncbi:ABC transporter substrate-binding protein [Desulfonatronovibrio hydrogenovorans]|uniref:ABC transporter substrate-binding protein n=1 Tax=Desulfonatronovibrio hydrogenovorans TaxID=53245 RepID=UPI0004920A3D|nr:ABC transporter substrate-binding protein [Desulfonatronovibrio hydrogenovorans]